MIKKQLRLGLLLAMTIWLVAVGAYGLQSFKLTITVSYAVALAIFTAGVLVGWLLYLGFDLPALRVMMEKRDEL
ncbi:MAG: hypothetical protein AAB360_02910 [Patescibacteria group bacterium]